MAVAKLTLLYPPRECGACRSMNIDPSTHGSVHESVARLALIVYTNDEGTDGVVMQHQLSEKKGKLSMAEGHPVTRSTIDTLLSLNAMQTLQYVPEQVVAVGTNALAWVQERQPRHLLFHGARDPAVAALDNQSFEQPRLLFIGRGLGLSVYALRGTERPSARTALYFAPYFNVFSNHQVCSGSMTRPSSLTPEQTGAWSESFFRSNFTHGGDSNKRWAYPGTYRELWEAVRAAGEFKDEWLVPAGVTLEEALGHR